MPETAFPGSPDPFAVPAHRRHLRHAFYRKHPDLDRRSQTERVGDEALYEADRAHRRAAARERSAPAESRLDSELPPEHDPDDPPERAGSGDPRDDLAEAVRRFLDGRATLDELGAALDRTEGHR